MAPLKCGTRYLRSLGLQNDHIHLTNEDWYRAYQTNWEIIVLRNPMEHLKSALQTELLNLYNQHNLWSGMTTESVLDRFISELGCDHWSGYLYKTIYELWIHQSKIPKIVDLNDISYFISNMGYHIPYIKNKYDFTNSKIWMSKTDIFKMIETDYNWHYNKILKLYNIDKYYYDKFNFEKVNKNII